MKKVLGLTLMLMFIASNCFAMTFSQPEKIGSVFLYEGTFDLKGYSYNKVIQSSKWRDYTFYEKGIAIFGTGNDALYFYYDKDTKVQSPTSDGTEPISRFGSSDINNAIQVSPLGTDIYLIKTDTDRTFYLLENSSPVWWGGHCVLIGKNKDGKFFRYFDTSVIKKKYRIGTSSRPNNDGKFYCNNDTITICYTSGSDGSILGEFRFKWDESAQWFGVQHIVY